jgi:hypothetical protein
LFHIFKQGRQEDFTKIWRKKNNNRENCGLALYAKNQENQWFIDSGCSNHMIGDKSKFEFLTKEKSGNVTFGNNAPARIIGEGIVVLDEDKNGKTKEHNVLYVDGLKHNFFISIQMCDQGNNVIFYSRGCKVINVNTGKTIVKVVKTLGNVYVLEEGKKNVALVKLMRYGFGKKY